MLAALVGGTAESGENRIAKSKLSIIAARLIMSTERQEFVRELNQIALALVMCSAAAAYLWYSL